MRYDELITKQCPLIRDTCKGEGCAAYHGTPDAGECRQYGQRVGDPVPAPAPAPAV